MNFTMILITNLSRICMKEPNLCIPMIRVSLCVLNSKLGMRCSITIVLSKKISSLVSRSLKIKKISSLNCGLNSRIDQNFLLRWRSKIIIKLLDNHSLSQPKNLKSILMGKINLFMKEESIALRICSKRSRALKEKKRFLDLLSH